ncbi:hypothetical protein IDJ75_04900 [Mucilaginibacter rigui]|uniref:Pentapeptide repeat-containing protein n=1 Tax=Mucilaginibacter rigui TaxID=534635 RepID=A0ABR7X1Y9_9SPHI|nr:hypothetical protein [Mucilaginibacter rigui]MBD1384608.1 hypothetical protein [Mucilaginibacter rigui]
MIAIRRPPKSQPTPPPTFPKDAIQTIEGINIDYLELKEADYKAKHTTFRNVAFKSLVLFDGTKLSHGLLFEDIEFPEAVVFKNVIVDQYDQLISPDSVSIVFKNCTFKQPVQIIGQHTHIDRSICFDNCIFYEGLSIERITVVKEGLSFKNCEIHQKLDIFNSVFNSDITFRETHIHAYLRLFAVKSGMLVFSKLNIDGNLHLDSSTFPNGIVFNDGNFKDDVYFTLNKTDRSGLTMIGSSFEKSITINHQSKDKVLENGISQYYISSAKFSNGLSIKGISNLASPFPKVKEITLDISSLLIGSIVFDSLDIGILNLSGYNTLAKVTFKHTAIRQIRAKEFINESGLIFSDVIASGSDWPDGNNGFLGSALYMDNTNFGKAQFFQTNFKSFEKVVFTNIILTEIATSNVTWFTAKKLEDGIIVSLKTKLKATIKTKDKLKIEQDRNALIRELNTIKEIYRQLKFAAQKQGDIPLSHEFQRIEMGYYKEITQVERPRRWSEFLILYSSQSNNFGQSWVRALWGLIVFSFICYIPVGFLTSEHLDYTKAAVSLDDLIVNARVIFLDNIKTWLTLFNPTHRVKDITESIDKFSSWVYFWDFISRIVVAYFIFQMVSAFRKFSK